MFRQNPGYCAASFRLWASGRNTPRVIRAAVLDELAERQAALTGSFAKLPQSAQFLEDGLDLRW